MRKTATVGGALVLMAVFIGCSGGSGSSSTAEPSPATSAMENHVSVKFCQRLDNGKWVTNDSPESATPCTPEKGLADLPRGSVTENCAYHPGTCPPKHLERPHRTHTTTPTATTTTAATSETSTAPPPAPPIGPSLSKVASGHAAGDFAVVQTSGTVEGPSKIELKITASPPQQGTVSWDLVCDETGGGVGSKSGQSDISLPGTQNLPLPATSDRCIVSANVQLSQGGDVTIAIYG